MGVAFTAVSCSESASSSEEEPEENLTVLADQDNLSANTGSAVTFRSLQGTVGGALVLIDGTTGAVLLVSSEGQSVVFTAPSQIEALTGEDSVRLGPFIQLLASGESQFNLVTADAVSGLLILIDSATGVPSLLATAATIETATGQEPDLTSPRETAANQVFAQNLNTGDLLLFGLSTGTVSPNALVEASEITEASGSATPLVTGWAKGNASLTNPLQFAFFSSTATIISLNSSGTISVHTPASEIEDLFSDVTNLNILDVVSDTASDSLLALIGEGTRGIAVIAIDEDGNASLFAGEEALATVAGSDFRLSDLDILPAGFPFAVDTGGSQLIAFDRFGRIELLSARADVEEIAPGSRLETGAPLGNTGMVTPDLTGGSLIFHRFR
ncbi:MAG: hypothetical protein AAF517_02130 [Planctomycetota bacterium]